MNILGLDLSLTATGIAEPDGCPQTFKSAHRGVDRLVDIRNAVISWARTCRVDLVALEGYSFASKGSGIYQIAELGGVVRVALHEHDIPLVVIPPACVKKYATGSGLANKLQVALAAQKRLKVEVADDNAADAAWLRAMAMDAYGAAPPAVPASHRSTLAKITWPTVGGHQPFPAAAPTPST